MKYGELRAGPAIVGLAPSSPCLLCLSGRGASSPTFGTASLGIFLPGQEQEHQERFSRDMRVAAKQCDFL